jgi:hypothetical protein
MPLTYVHDREDNNHNIITVHMLGLLYPLSCTYVRAVVSSHVHMLGLLSPLSYTYIRGIVSSIMYIC